MTGVVDEMDLSSVAMVCQAREGGIAESSRIDPSCAHATRTGTEGEGTHLDLWDLVAVDGGSIRLLDDACIRRRVGPSAVGVQ